MSRGLFVTGTDTDVGKTWVSLGLMQVLQKAGYQVNGMKPVAAGCDWQDGQLVNADALALQQQSSPIPDYVLVNPYALQAPIAPHLAAAQAARPIDLVLIKQHFERLNQTVEVTIVEGAGGWRVPLNAHQDISDMALLLGLPVILVVGMRLGCLNHALLSGEAILRKGLPLAGWVANQCQPSMPGLADNIVTLQQAIPAPCLGVMPYQDSPGTMGTAAYWSLQELLVLLGKPRSQQDHKQSH